MGEPAHGDDRAAAPRAVVIEDDLATQRLLRELASAAGWQAAGYSRLAPARRALRAHPPELLLVDDDLPDGRGLDLVRELRANPRTRNVKVHFCTAADAHRRREIAAVAPVVPKPFSLIEVEAALARLRHD